MNCMLPAIARLWGIQCGAVILPVHSRTAPLWLQPGDNAQPADDAQSLCWAVSLEDLHTVPHLRQPLVFADGELFGSGCCTQCLCASMYTHASAAELPCLVAGWLAGWLALVWCCCKKIVLVLCADCPCPLCHAAVGQHHCPHNPKAPTVAPCLFRILRHWFIPNVRSRFCNRKAVESSW